MSGIGYKSKANLTYEFLKERIVSGEIETDAPLVIDRLTKEIGVSQTPVREALRRLEAEGLVIYTPHEGARVAPVSLKELEELHLLRSALEGLAAEFAAINLSDSDIEQLGFLSRVMAEAIKANDSKEFVSTNERFHKIIVAGSKNEVLMQMYTDVMGRAARYRIGTHRLEHLSSKLNEEHEAIVAALKRRDSEAARSIIETHIRRSMREIMRYYAKSETNDDAGGEAAVS